MSYRQVSVKLESPWQIQLRLIAPALPDRLFTYTLIVMHRTSTSGHFFTI